MKTDEKEVLIAKVKASNAYATALKIIAPASTGTYKIHALNVLGLQTISNVACGAGGAGSVRLRRDGSVHMQVSYGKGRYNYATVVVLGSILDSGNGLEFKSAI